MKISSLCCSIIHNVLFVIEKIKLLLYYVTRANGGPPLLLPLPTESAPDANSFRKYLEKKINVFRFTIAGRQGWNDKTVESATVSSGGLKKIRPFPSGGGGGNINPFLLTSAHSAAPTGFGERTDA